VRSEAEEKQVCRRSKISHHCDPQVKSNAK
jgi:hypothetical protein